MEKEVRAGCQSEVSTTMAVPATLLPSCLQQGVRWLTKLGSRRRLLKLATACSFFVVVILSSGGQQPVANCLRLCFLLILVLDFFFFTNPDLLAILPLIS